MAKHDERADPGLGQQQWQLRPVQPGPPGPQPNDLYGPGLQAVNLIARIVAAVELTPAVAVCSFDRHGLVHFWNQACAQLYGMDADAALGRPLQALLWPGAAAGPDGADRADRADAADRADSADRAGAGEFAEFADSAEAFRAAVEQIWEGGQAAPPRDCRVRTAGGRRLWVYSTMFPVWRGGELQQIFRMDIDITARKREEDALLAVGAHVRQLFGKSGDAMLLIRAERIVEANPAALALFGCASPGQMLGQSLLAFSPPQQGPGETSALAGQRHVEQAYHEGNCRFDWRYRRCDGQLFWGEVLLTSVTLDHEYLFYAVIRDISARKLAESNVYLAAQVFENSHDAILLTDQAGTIIAVNRAYADVTGFAVADIVGQPLARHRAGLEDAARFEQLWHELDAGAHWQGEVWALRRNGERFPAWLALTAIRDRNDVISNYMLILSDITDRKKSEETTRHLAEHDFLTDLPNRVLLLDRLSLALTAARRNHSMLAILFLDLDRFKHINDTLGHHIGDLLLKEVAQRLVACVRGVDTVSRQGGDEFVIILADIGGIDQAAHVAASVLQALTRPYQLEQHQLDVTTSLGVSIYPDDGDDIDTLIKNADIAMYHAKERGRNRFQFFNAAMNAQIVERVSFENGLRQALRRGELLLDYLPEIEIASGAVTGAEALIRWQHPQLGRLLPERFVGVAEDCGLMVPIGHWVLRQACLQARRWHEAGHALVVAVNLSSAQFMQNNLLASVGEALEQARLAPRWLELEVTEALIMKHGAGALATLEGLRRLGVRLTIDDFGTGYSRLGQFKDYPVDRLKIDRSFMAGITGHPDDAAVITAIIGMARSLKLTVVAEGVETAEQLDFLRRQGCQSYQGQYALAAPAARKLAGLLGPAAAP